MDENRERFRKLAAIFSPTAYSRMEAFSNSAGRLVHYTTAEAAIRICQSKCIWLRNARTSSPKIEMENCRCGVLLEEVNPPLQLFCVGFLKNLAPSNSVLSPVAYFSETESERNLKRPWNELQTIWNF